MTTEDAARAARAEARRGRVLLRKTRLGDEVDPWPVRGADAVSLSTQAHGLGDAALLRRTEGPVVVRFVRREP
ncbi:MAG: hypothetical protein J0L92_10930 [Deltaproteobacteria bacterium]|nr:hypothetical protein [Deltaproteobacteria bacterium]